MGQHYAIGNSVCTHTFDHLDVQRALDYLYLEDGEEKFVYPGNLRCGLLVIKLEFTVTQ